MQEYHVRIVAYGDCTCRHPSRIKVQMD